MAQLKEILEVEKRRSNFAEQRIIHLFPEGTFYRAYEWSAWLCSRYMGNLKATHRQYKNTEQSVVFVGFPQTSLQKFVPEGSTIKEESEGRLDILLSEKLFPEPPQRDRLKEDFEHWKLSQPVTESPAQKRNSQTFVSVVDTVAERAGILQRIMSFPIEQKSPIECMLFLADLRREIASLL